jgi:hypothetical protein
LSPPGGLLLMVWKDSSWSVLISGLPCRQWMITVGILFAYIVALVILTLRPGSAKSLDWRLILGFGSAAPPDYGWTTCKQRTTAPNTPNAPAKKKCDVSGLP